MTSTPCARDKHFKFHKVVQRHYSGEVENAYTILWQIYSRNYVTNFIRIARDFTVEPLILAFESM